MQAPARIKRKHTQYRLNVCISIRCLYHVAKGSLEQAHIPQVKPGAICPALSSPAPPQGVGSLILTWRVAITPTLPTHGHNSMGRKLHLFQGCTPMCEACPQEKERSNSMRISPYTLNNTPANLGIKGAHVSLCKQYCVRAKQSHTNIRHTQTH